MMLWLSLSQSDHQETIIINKANCKLFNTITTLIILVNVCFAVWNFFALEEYEKRKQQVCTDCCQKAREHTLPCPDMTGQPVFTEGV